MEITVMFLGVLAEVAGSGTKHYSGVASFDDLMLRMKDEMPALFYHDYFLIINDAIPEGQIVLRDGDKITLVPSFAGNSFLTQA